MMKRLLITLFAFITCVVLAQTPAPTYFDTIVTKNASGTNVIGGSLKVVGATTSTTFTATAGPHWTPYANSVATTVTIYIANGDIQALSCTGATVIASDPSHTNDVASIRLDLWAGTNAVTWTTNTISGTEDLDISTNSCTTVLLDRQWSNAVWRARQL